jgi:hypothetical protein
VKHLQAAGFSVETHMMQNLDSVPERQRVPEKLRSCHTAVVGGYLVEGHIPAAVVRRLLAEKPKITGIAVPGMPSGSPGMESPAPEPYEVIAFGPGDKTYVFARVAANGSISR